MATKTASMPPSIAGRPALPISSINSNACSVSAFEISWPRLPAKTASPPTEETRNDCSVPGFLSAGCPDHHHAGGPVRTQLQGCRRQSGGGDRRQEPQGLPHLPGWQGGGLADHQQAL